MGTQKRAPNLGKGDYRSVDGHGGIGLHKRGDIGSRGQGGAGACFVGNNSIGTQGHGAQELGPEEQDSGTLARRSM